MGGQIRIYRVGRQPQELLAHLSHPQGSIILQLWLQFVATR
nr:MAG TPA: hypothetical protein [Caudoviricetes sp.]